MSTYGECSECGDALKPVWFIEEEETVTYGVRTKTGRKRKACSHLLCESCGNTECVDDSFDGSWYR